MFWCFQTAFIRNFENSFLRYLYKYEVSIHVELEQESSCSCEALYDVVRNPAALLPPQPFSHCS